MNPLLEATPRDDIPLRAATAADGPAIVAVFLSSRRTFIPYAPVAHDDEAVARWMAEGPLREGRVTVACAGDTVVGMLVVARADDAGWIDQLYLAPGRTGLGLGARLLAHAIDTLPPALPLRLYTFQANARARAFYERHGFRAVATSNGADNEERCPDVLYERPGRTP